MPETGVNVLNRVNAEAVKARLLDPVLINRRHVRADKRGLGAKIIQPGKFAELVVLRGVVVRDTRRYYEKDSSGWD